MKIPVTNNTASPIFVASQMIPPGETRHFEAHHVPPEHRPVPADPEPEAAPAPHPLAQSLDAKVADVLAGLAALSDAELAEIETLEREGRNRKGVIEGIAAERLERGARQAGGGDGEGGDGGA